MTLLKIYPDPMELGFTPSFIVKKETSGMRITGIRMLEKPLLMRTLASKKSGKALPNTSVNLNQNKPKTVFIRQKI